MGHVLMSSLDRSKDSSHARLKILGTEWANRVRQSSSRQRSIMNCSEPVAVLQSGNRSRRRRLEKVVCCALLARWDHLFFVSASALHTSNDKHHLRCWQEHLARKSQQRSKLVIKHLILCYDWISTAYLDAAASVSPCRGVCQWRNRPFAQPP